VFNPIFPLPLDRGSWIVADWLSIGAMFIAVFAFGGFRKPDRLCASSYEPAIPKYPYLVKVRLDGDWSQIN
jgi:hypothetical protein